MGAKFSQWVKKNTFLFVALVIISVIIPLIICAVLIVVGIVLLRSKRQVGESTELPISLMHKQILHTNLYKKFTEIQHVMKVIPSKPHAIFIVHWINPHDIHSGTPPIIISTTYVEIINISNVADSYKAIESVVADTNNYTITGNWDIIVSDEPTIHNYYISLDPRVT